MGALMRLMNVALPKVNWDIKLFKPDLTCWKHFPDFTGKSGFANCLLVTDCDYVRELYASSGVIIQSAHEFIANHIITSVLLFDDSFTQTHVQYAVRHRNYKWTKIIWMTITASIVLTEGFRKHNYPQCSMAIA